ncbi:MAG: type II secretion system protein GspM [Proteobacteria bacterium]|nr:type II secretion system protein GspM [Pseudomonadota bacterium]
MNELWGRVRAAWDNLSPRERLILSVAGALLGVMLLSMAVVNPILSASESARSRAEEAEQQVRVMARLRREYDGINSRLAAIEQRIAQSRGQTKIRTLLESLASRSAVKIDSMEERETPDSDRYRETKMEVSLRNVTLTQTVNYLHNLEAAERPLSIKSLRIKSNKSRGDDGELLDVTFTVSSFDPV